jgi:predicted GIY-YIG superfamily endonuclease
MKSKKNNKIYVGSTSKLPEIRVNEHNQGSNVWSKNNKPFDLIYYEKYFCQKDVRRRELFYKSGFGKQIKNIIVNKVESFIGE